MQSSTVSFQDSRPRFINNEPFNNPSIPDYLRMDSSEQFSHWCQLIKASDRRAYEHVFRALYDPLMRYATNLTKDSVTAGDIVQDVFLKLWEVRNTLDPARSLKALLYRMVRNLAFNLQRDTKNREAKHTIIQQEKQPDVAGADQNVDSNILEQKLKGWIDELPDRQREALSLSRFEGLSHEQIAAMMEISPRTVNNHLVKALKHIRDRIRMFEPTLLDA